MKVKICGITNPEDARKAVDAGADFIGLNFVAGPRQIEWDAAKTIVSALDDIAEVVALIRLGEKGLSDEDARGLERCGIRILQPYGNVTTENVGALTRSGYRIFLVQSVPPDSFPEETDRFLESCGAGPEVVLLDAHVPGKLGGTGRTLDWNAVSSVREAGKLDGWPLLMLAGGLTPDNVSKAVEIVKPWGVDVASGVEETAGVKSEGKMREFVRSATES